MMPKRVLVIEGDPYIRKRISWRLRDVCDVFEAGCRGDALSILRAEKIDLILLGPDPPADGSEDGLGFLREVKGRHPRIPIVVVGGEEDIDEIAAIASLVASPIGTRR